MEKVIFWSNAHGGCSCSVIGVHILVVSNPLGNFAIFLCGKTEGMQKSCCLRNSYSTRAPLAGVLLQVGTRSFPGVSSGGLFALFFPVPSTQPTHKRVNCHSHPWEVAKQHPWAPAPALPPGTSAATRCLWISRWFCSPAGKCSENLAHLLRSHSLIGLT